MRTVITQDGDEMQGKENQTGTEHASCEIPSGPYLMILAQCFRVARRLSMLRFAGIYISFDCFPWSGIPLPVCWIVQGSCVSQPFDRALEVGVRKKSVCLCFTRSSLTQ
jgi:hypothetical protein